MVHTIIFLNWWASLWIFITWGWALGKYQCPCPLLETWVHLGWGEAKTGTPKHRPQVTLRCSKNPGPLFHILLICKYYCQLLAINIVMLFVTENRSIPKYISLPQSSSVIFRTYCLSANLTLASWLFQSILKSSGTKLNSLSPNYCPV